MKTGDWVLWGGLKFQILTEYDEEYVYLQAGENSAQLVHISELTQLQ